MRKPWLTALEARFGVLGVLTFTNWACMLRPRRCKCLNVGSSCAKNVRSRVDQGGVQGMVNTADPLKSIECQTANLSKPKNWVAV